MVSEKKIRIDKWLWAVRIFKTRNQATEACKKGKILINDMPVKPSHTIRLDEIVVVKKLPVIHTYRITGFLEKRLPAKLVVNYVENLTPEYKLEKSIMNKISVFVRRNKGLGRPTKKERRTLDKLKNSNY